MTTGLLQQFGLFLLVGAVTTGIDFCAYNLLTRRPLGWGRIQANLLSSTAAMSFSFTVNGWLVFQTPRDGLWLPALKFVAVTCLSSYGIQSLVIHFLSVVWRKPVRLAQAVALRLPWVRRCGAEFVDKNAVKAAAVLAGLLWNFLGYRWIVFR